jgi:flagellar motor switch protein FliG
LNLKADETADQEGDTIIQTQDYRNYIIMIGALLLFLMLMFLVIFSTRMGKLSRALKEVNIPGLESVLRPANVAQTTTRQKEKRSDEPVTVRLLPQEETKKETIDFKFIENLSSKSCGELLSNEAPEAAAFVLSQLSSDFVSRFFSEFDGNTEILLRSMIKGKQLPKSEITRLHQRLLKNYDELIEKQALSYDNESLIANIINNLPAIQSEDLFKKIHSLDSSFANLMRKDVFLLEDLADLEAYQVELIIRNIDRNLLINYLSVAPPLIKEKFFNNMTSRNRQIFADELENTTPLAKEDIIVVKDQLLDSVRQLFALA